MDDASASDVMNFSVAQEEYVVRHASDDEDDDDARDATHYVHIVERDSVPLVFFAEDADPLRSLHRTDERGKKNEPVVPQELVYSPKFKLFIYTCKQCDFKCNAIKELTAHRSKEHASVGPAGKYRSAARPKTTPPPAPASPTELDSGVVAFSVDTCHCSVCGYSSPSPQTMRRHILKAHRNGRTTGGRGARDAAVSKSSRLERDRGPETSGDFYECQACKFASDDIGEIERHECVPEDDSRQ